MKSAKKLLGALALIGAASSAYAVPTISNGDGSFTFSGFDWDKFGSVLISGYDVTNASAPGTVDNFTLDYQAFATAVYDANGNVLSLGGLRQGTGTGYEYTVVLHANESVTYLGSNLALLNVLSGSYDIYYQLAGDANRVTGTGYNNGTLLLSGTIFNSFGAGSTPVIAPQGATNPGNASLSASVKGSVDYTNLTYVNPALTGSDATTTLQFGNTINSGWVRPGEVDGVAVPGTNTNTTYVGQADGNQSFAVPEPASLALFGIAMVGLGIGSRRKSA